MSVLDWAGTLLVALVLLATATALATAGRTWRTASDTRRSPPRSRPILTACVLVAVVIVTAGIASLSRAKTHLSAVQHDLAALQALARDGPAAIVPMQPGELLAQTHEDLARIQAAYAIPLSVAPHMGWVPYYGADIQAAPTLLQMGLDLTSTGQHLVDALSPLLKSDNGGMKGPDELVLVLETAHPALVEAQATLAQVHTVRQSMDVDGLSPRMTGWLTQLDGTLPLIQGGVHGLLALPELLGASEPRAILVLIQNEDELRATGGFISGVARVVVDRGRIVELVFEDSYAIDDFSLPSPGRDPVPEPDHAPDGGSAGELPRRGRGPIDHRTDLVEGDREHVVEDERQPFCRGEGVEHDQQRQAHRIG